MQDPRMAPASEIPNSNPNPKSRKKKASNPPRASLVQLPGIDAGDVQPAKAQKPSKRNLINTGSPLFQQSERSNSDSLPDSSTNPGSEYRALRRKYLLLEEESFGVGAELKQVEDEVKTLEDEKLALLDQLVVLEGLIDPSEMQPYKT